MLGPRDKDLGKIYHEQKRKELEEAKAAKNAPVIINNNVMGGSAAAPVGPRMQSPGVNPAGSATPAINNIERKIFSIGTPLIP